MGHPPPKPRYMDILATLKEDVNKETSLSSISQKLAIDQNKVQIGLNAAIPMVLAGIMKKGESANPGVLSSIFTGNTFPVDTNPEVELQNETNLLNRGKALISEVFGVHEGQVNSALSQQTGLSSENSSSLLIMGVPLITGFIGKLISGNNWTIPEFLSNLTEQREDIIREVPDTLAETMGFSVSESAPEVVVPPTTPLTSDPEEPLVSKEPHSSPSDDVPPIEKTVPHATLAPEPKSSSGGVLKWIIIVALLALAAWYFFGQKGCNDAVNSPLASDSLQAKGDTLLNNLTSDAKNIGTAIGGAVNEAGDWVYELGNQTTIKLPNGEELHVGEKSVEKHLVDFIQDENETVDADKWFPMDRLYFETGEATLKDESGEQLKNIADIMAAYPQVKLKLGGYTNNTGPENLNKKISAERAKVAMEKLLGMGVSSSRLASEGYGSSHPIADNSTEAGRAQNRRIDINVIAK